MVLSSCLTLLYCNENKEILIDEWWQWLLTMQDKIILDRHLHLAQKVLVVDGLIGGGKYLVSSILGALPTVECWSDGTQIQQLCALSYLKKTTPDAAQLLIQHWTDNDIYDTYIGRDANVRIADLSSIWHHRNKWTHIKRLVRRYQPLEHERFVREIINKKPILNIMTHAVTSTARPLFDALGERLVFVRVVRHPSTKYMLEHLSNWTEKWRDDKRAGMIQHRKIIDGKRYPPVPYAALGYEDEYISGSAVDRSIILLKHWQKQGDQIVDRIKAESGSIIIEIPYEKFVFEPMVYINSVASALGVTPDKKTKKEMKKQNVPRNSLTDAPVSKLYRRYGWTPSDSHNLSIDEELKIGRSYALKKSSESVMEIFDQISDDYYKRYLDPNV